jgi:hypothetical protein
MLRSAMLSFRAAVSVAALLIATGCSDDDARDEPREPFDAGVADQVSSELYIVGAGSASWRRGAPTQPASWCSVMRSST